MQVAPEAAPERVDEGAEPCARRPDAGRPPAGEPARVDRRAGHDVRRVQPHQQPPRLAAEHADVARNVEQQRQEEAAAGEGAVAHLLPGEAQGLGSCAGCPCNGPAQHLGLGAAAEAREERVAQSHARLHERRAAVSRAQGDGGPEDPADDEAHAVRGAPEPVHREARPLPRLHVAPTELRQPVLDLLPWRQVVARRGHDEAPVLPPVDSCRRAGACEQGRAQPNGTVAAASPPRSPRPAAARARVLHVAPAAGCAQRHLATGRHAGQDAGAN
mmetsp:Transcript_11536/g.35730  ORF Transcript_11536/g.35730 Transcript_11536/m.35730 type:complete len:273 (+) Transcript_11536:343-1161(+)